MSRLRLLGHPMHPMTVHLPLGLLLATTAFDVAAAFFGASWVAHARVALVGGLVASLPALVFGAIDYATIPQGARHVRIATIHMGCSLTGLSLYTVSVALRGAATESVPPAALAASVAGAATLVVTGWLGAELVFGYGEGVRSGPDGAEEQP